MRTKFLLIFLAMSLLALPYNLLALESAPEKVTYLGESKKFAIMVSDVSHFRIAIRTAQLMDISNNNFIFEIVAGGRLAKDLAEDESLKSDIDKSQKLGINIVVCEGALTAFGASKDQLDKRLLTTRNALIYMFELKDKGYNTLNF